MKRKSTFILIASLLCLTVIACLWGNLISAYCISYYDITFSFPKYYFIGAPNKADSLMSVTLHNKYGLQFNRICDSYNLSAYRWKYIKYYNEVIEDYVKRKYKKDMLSDLVAIRIKASEKKRNIVDDEKSIAEFNKYFHEPSINKRMKDSSYQAYRFYWWRAFDHNICIRVIIHQDSSGLIIAKKRHIVKDSWILDTTFRVSHITSEIDKQMANYDLWSDDIKHTFSQLDGSVWILEGLRDRKYNIVKFTSPKDGPFKELCLCLLKFSGIKNERIY
jgi:hypothetical protein